MYRNGQDGYLDAKLNTLEAELSHVNYQNCLVINCVNNFFTKKTTSFQIELNQNCY